MGQYIITIASNGKLLNSVENFKQVLFELFQFVS